MRALTPDFQVQRQGQPRLCLVAARPPAWAWGAGQSGEAWRSRGWVSMRSCSRLAHLTPPPRARRQTRGKAAGGAGGGRARAGPGEPETAAKE